MLEKSAMEAQIANDAPLLSREAEALHINNVMVRQPTSQPHGLQT